MQPNHHLAGRCGSGVGVLRVHGGAARHRESADKHDIASAFNQGVCFHPVSWGTKHLRYLRMYLYRIPCVPPLCPPGSTHPQRHPCPARHPSSSTPFCSAHKLARVWRVPAFASLTRPWKLTRTLSILISFHVRCSFSPRLGATAACLNQYEEKDEEGERKQGARELEVGRWNRAAGREGGRPYSATEDEN